MTCMNMRSKLLLLLLLFGAIIPIFADGTKDDVEVLYKYRFGVNAQIKLTKGLKLNLEPEFRFNDGYDKLLLNGGLTYKTFGCIYWGATYRLDVDREDSSSSSSMYDGYSGFFGSSDHESQIYHRFAFDVTYKEKFGRFTPSFRLRYNNFTDDDIDDKAFMRYRAKVDYNIRKCKFTPHLAMEAYQEMGDNKLYKTRFATGVELKTSKKSALSFDYKFDLFALEYKNANIFSFGYKFKL